MKKISVIYWSNGGNVEVLANTISQSVKEHGVEVVTMHVEDANIDDVLNSDAVAFRSPSMDNNAIEQKEMEPFINEFKLIPVNEKKIILFGSYGWDDGEFMTKWVNRMKDYGFCVLGHLAVKESPTEEQLVEAKKLGETLAKNC